MGSGSSSWADPLNLSPGPPFLDFSVSQSSPAQAFSYCFFYPKPSPVSLSPSFNKHTLKDNQSINKTDIEVRHILQQGQDYGAASKAPRMHKALTLRYGACTDCTFFKVAP